MSDEERLGQAGVGAGAGYEPRYPAEPTESDKPKPYEGDGGTIDAANDLTNARGTGTEAPIIERKYADDDPKKTVTARQVAHDLSEAHQREAFEEFERTSAPLVEEIDLARAWATGQPPPQQAQTEPQQAQPEAAQQQSQPDPGISHLPSKLQEALQDPASRALLDREMGAAEQARAGYASAATQAAQLAAQSLLAAFPELSGLNAQKIPVAIRMIQQQNPQRHAEIQGHLGRVQGLYNLAQQAQQTQAQLYQQHVGEFVKREDAAFEKSISNDNPEIIKTVKQEVLNVARDAYGISTDQMRHAFQANPILHSAPFQKMMYDAVRFQLAQKTAQSNPASRGNVAPVQKPGVATSRGEAAEYDVRELRNEMRGSSGLDQMRIGVKLLQAQRAARSR